MSHRNSVILTGPFTIVSAELTGGKDVETVMVVAEVETGPANKGEVHRVILYGHDARVAAAFVEAHGCDGMEATVYGSLRSMGDNVKVFVERITFHIHSEEVTIAQRALRGSRVMR